MRAFVTRFTKQYRAAQRRFGADQGIAIGPILFVVAILAVLVGAIAAGSGGFSSSTGAQSTKIVASTLLEQANNFKTAVDNLTVNGVAVASIVTTGAGASTGTTGLYSATGGGIAPQVAPSTAVPAGSDWAILVNQTIPGIGTLGNDYVAAVPVTQAVCTSLVQTLFGSSATIDTATGTITITSNKVSAIDATGGTSGRMQSCVKSGVNYVFYQVLAIG